MERMHITLEIYEAEKIHFSSNLFVEEAEFPLKYQTNHRIN